MNFNYLEFEKFHTKHHIYEDETKEMLSDILEINFIEIPKFIKAKKDLNNPLHRWLLFLANPEDSELEEIEMEDSKIKRAHEILDSLNSDEETIRLAELREKYSLDERSRIEGAKEEGIKKGKTEILLKQLTQKFNIIPDEYKKILMKLPEKKLEIIAIEIFNINNIKEIERYF